MEIAIIGAGLLGSGASLELAARGHRITLIEALDEPLRGAAIANEGKLHFGYVYGRDTSLATARLMLRGALAMAPALRRWVDDGSVDRLPRGAPYRYAVHRDSLSTPDELAGHYAACAELARGVLGQGPVDCFGADPRDAPRRIPLREDTNPALIQAMFQTSEISLDCNALADLLRPRLLSEPRITVLARTRAMRAQADPDGITLQLDGPEGPQHRRFAHVINASWESRLALDATLGIAPPPEWLFRLKLLVHVHSRQNFPLAPTTICLGAFGDVVVLEGGRTLLSWYPAGRRATSQAIAPPDWPRRLEGDAAQAIRKAMVDGLGELFPPLLALHDDPALAASAVKGGIIYARGTQDVHDPASGLHGRAAIGRHSVGRWHSVDPGKWTTAPLFAMEVADHIAPRQRMVA